MTENWLCVHTSCTSYCSMSCTRYCSVSCTSYCSVSCTSYCSVSCTSYCSVSCKSTVQCRARATVQCRARALFSVVHELLYGVVHELLFSVVHELCSVVHELMCYCSVSCTSYCSVSCTSYCATVQCRAELLCYYCSVSRRATVLLMFSFYTILSPKPGVLLFNQSKQTHKQYTLIPMTSGEADETGGFDEQVKGQVGETSLLTCTALFYFSSFGFSFLF